jgi:hypothetical protein
MSNTYYGTWSPATGSKPTVTDLDFGAYYILETGTLDGDSTAYTAGQWLLYICDSRGTKAEKAYWRTSNGIVVFNSDTHTNVPNAGYYTKVRLDNNGNIVQGESLEIDDLPSDVLSTLDKISDDNIQAQAKTVLSTLFKNDVNNPIQLKWDSKLQKITATLNFNPETLEVNDDNELSVIGSTGSSGTSTSGLETITATISTIDKRVTALEKRVTTVETNLKAATPVEGDGISVDYDKGGAVVSAKIDGTTISLNSNGELCIDPDKLADYINGGECGNHTHTASQITDFDTAVKSVISNYTIADSVKTSLSSLVDGTTIIINKDGELEAIATDVQAHTHKMDDITDLNQDIANVWASNQNLHADNSNENFNDGAVLMGTLTIGEILIAFNQLFENYNTKISDLAKKAGTVEPAAPSLISAASFSIDTSDSIDVINTDTLKTVSAINKLSVSTSDIIYLDGSDLTAYIDGTAVGTLACYGHDDTGTVFGEGNYDDFNVTYCGDAYPKITTFQGYYKGFSFTFNYSASLTEGIHTVYFQTKNITTGVVTKSSTLTFNYYVPITPVASISIDNTEMTTQYVSGVKCFTGTQTITVTPSLQCYSKLFAPVYSGLFSASTVDEYEIAPTSFGNGFAVFSPIKVTLPDFMGKYHFFFEGYNVVKTLSNKADESTVYINIDNSTYETYRVHQTSPADSRYVPIEDENYTFADWDSTQDLTKAGYLYEAQVKDNTAIIASMNYSTSEIGPDYSKKASEQYITLRFKAPYFNNFYFDLTDSDGNAFTLDKYGAISSLDIYASESNSSSLVTKWIDCNKPFIGYGNWSTSGVYAGLDLTRSTNTRRWVTLGKRPSVSSGYLFLRIGFTTSIKLETLISSIEECLNER